MDPTIGRKLFFAVLVVALPLAATLYLIFAGMTVVIVRNVGAENVHLMVVSQSGRWLESSDPRTVKADSLAYLILSPRIAGAGAVQCIAPKTVAKFPIGPVAPDGFLATYLRIDACVHLLGRKTVAI